MVGPVRPQFVLFGSSIVQHSFYDEGWGAILSHLYARKADIVLRGYSGWNSRRALQVLDQIFPKNATEQPSLIIVYFGGNDSLLPHPSDLGQHVPLQEYIENMRKIAIHIKVNFHTRLALFCLSCYHMKEILHPPSISDAMLRKPRGLHENRIFAITNENRRLETKQTDPRLSLPHVFVTAKFDIGPNDFQSLPKKIPLIFLSSPPVNEAQIFGNSDLLGQPLRTNESCRIYSEACLELCREMNINAVDLWSAIQKRDDWRDVCFVDGIHLSAEGSKIVAKEILKILKEADWEPSLHWKSMPIEFGEDSPYDPIGPHGKPFNVSSFPFPATMEWD